MYLYIFQIKETEEYLGEEFSDIKMYLVVKYIKGIVFYFSENFLNREGLNYQKLSKYNLLHKIVF